MKGYGSHGSCPICDEPINDYTEDAVKQRGQWIHRWCAPGGDDDAEPGQRMSRSGRRYDRETGPRYVDGPRWRRRGR